MEDNDFLNQVDMGYIGLTRPRIVKQVLDEEMPTWVMRKFEMLARAEGLTYYEFMDKYKPFTDPSDWDNDPGSAEQAYA